MNILFERRSYSTDNRFIHAQAQLILLYRGIGGDWSRRGLALQLHMNPTVRVVS